MIVKLVSPEDKEKVKWLWAYCFENHEPFFSWYFSSYYHAKNTLGAFEKEKLLSCLQLIPYTIYCRDKEFDISYIVGLATYPEARGLKIVESLLQGALVEMRKKRHFLSILMPSRAEFYYQYEWEICYHHYRYTINLTDLRRMSKSWGDFSLVDNKDKIAALDEVYRSFVKNKHGYVVRNSQNWNLLLEEIWGEKGHIYLLEDEGKPQGYIMYVFRENRIFVREMAYSSFLAQKALFYFLYNHRSQMEFVEWSAPLDDYTYYLMAEPKKEVKLMPFLMGRIVDVVGALENISYPQDLKEKVNLKINDSLAYWNNGVFTLTIEEGKGQVEVKDDETWDVECSVGTLAHLVFGALGAKKLETIDRIKASLDTVQKLERIFPECNNYIDEYY